MSTLKVNAIKNTSDVEMYLCKAWVNFNGTGTVAIRASGNVSSITDNGTGTYTVNFTTAMSDANYATSGTASNGNNFVGIDSDAAAPTTSAVRVQTYDGANTLQDSAYTSIVIHR